MLVHMTAHRDGANAVRESGQKADWEKNLLAAFQSRTCVSKMLAYLIGGEGGGELKELNTAGGGWRMYSLVKQLFERYVSREELHQRN